MQPGGSFTEKRYPCGRPARQGLVTPKQVPADFEQMFVREGRLVCQEHYRVGRLAINDWLAERGKDRLIRERAAHVRDKRKGLSRGEMQRILRSVFPVPEQTISLTTARHAAQFLRAVRNGGWIISPAPDGMWWVGARKRTAVELVALAERRGWTGSLSADGDTKLG